MTVGISRSHTGPTHGQQRKRGLTDEGNTERHGESTGAVVSRTEPSAAGANSKGDVRVGDKKAVPREALNDELQKYWDDPLTKWKAGGEHPLARHPLAVRCDGHSGCFTVAPVRILPNYSKRYCSAHLQKPRMDRITGGLPPERGESLKTEASPARVRSYEISIEVR